MSRWLQEAGLLPGSPGSPGSPTKPTELTEPRPEGVLSVLSVLSEGGGGVEAPAYPDPDAFEERAAIAEFDGGLTRERAEALAAAAQGFPDPDALHAATVEGWRRGLDRLEAAARDPRAAARIAAARRFLHDGWGARALALGWSEVELFGADPRAPLNRLDRMGIARATRPTIALTPETATLRADDGKTQPRRHIRTNTDGRARQPWEMLPPARSGG